MKLFFDARYINTKNQDGVSRYSTELARSVSELNYDTTFLICDKNQLKYLPKNSKFILIHKPTSIKEPFTAIILNKLSPEVVFSPMQTIGSIGRKFKLIVTVHDLIYFKYNSPPKNFNWFIRALWWLYHLSYIPERILLNRVDMVATVSETTKKELLAQNLTNKKIVVAHNATRFSNNQRGLLTKPSNLIYMGSFIGYKNVETIIKGMQFISGCKLHLLSKISDNRRKELQKIVPIGSEVIFHNGVSDEEYQNILQKNAILVSASKDEGYGLPIVEALANSVPVVVSDIAIFHEIAGPGALYFNPDEPKDFAEKIEQIRDTKTYRETAVKGKNHIKKFNWENSARILLDEIASNLLK